MMLALWSRLNQRQVWQKLVGGLSNLHPREPLSQMSAPALTGRREELGSQVMEALMQICCQPMARREQPPEAIFEPHRFTAIDGTLLHTAATRPNAQASIGTSNP